ncbi:eight-cysteine-cluster domain-containing protein [Candidatus Woesearchaeota archaeon]|nr:eight-cysteine-cluster domain-containing protein [Candidatus Woesearchaeota archaeon]
MHYRHKFRILLFIFIILFVLFVKFTCYGQNGFLSWNEQCDECRCNNLFSYACEEKDCILKQEAFCGTSTSGSCQTQNDCVTDGCSGQICRSITDPSDIPTPTTCEYRDCYNNELYNMVCGCIENKCQWTSLG